jgi:hypothetical protein
MRCQELGESPREGTVVPFRAIYRVIDASVLLAMRGMSAMRSRVPYRWGLKTIMASITSTITPRA